MQLIKIFDPTQLMLIRLFSFNEIRQPFDIGLKNGTITQMDTGVTIVSSSLDKAEIILATQDIDYDFLAKSELPIYEMTCVTGVPGDFYVSRLCLSLKDFSYIALPVKNRDGFLALAKKAIQLRMRQLANPRNTIRPHIADLAKKRDALSGEGFLNEEGFYNFINSLLIYEKPSDLYPANPIYLLRSGSIKETTEWSYEESFSKIPLSADLRFTMFEIITLFRLESYYADYLYQRIFTADTELNFFRWILALKKGKV